MFFHDDGGRGGPYPPPEDGIIYEHPQMNAKGQCVAALAPVFQWLIPGQGHRYCTNWHAKTDPITVLQRPGGGGRKEKHVTVIVMALYFLKQLRKKLVLKHYMINLRHIQQKYVPKKLWHILKSFM